MCVSVVGQPQLADLLEAGGDVQQLAALAQSGQRSELSAALVALGFTKLGQRMRVERALLAAPPAVPEVDSAAFWLGVADSSARAVDGSAPSCNYEAHAAAVAAQASEARRREAAAAEAHAEAAAAAAVAREADTAWRTDGGVATALRSGFLADAGDELASVRGASGVSVAPKTGGRREASSSRGRLSPRHCPIPAALLLTLGAGRGGGGGERGGAARGCGGGAHASLSDAERARWW